MKNMNSMMKQAQKMQEDLQKAQEQLAQEEVTGESGGGMVKATGRASGLGAMQDARLFNEVFFASNHYHYHSLQVQHFHL